MRPFPGFNRKLTAQKASLYRLKRKDLSPQGDKAAMRVLCQQAVASHPITKLPTIPRTPWREQWGDA